MRRDDELSYNMEIKADQLWARNGCFEVIRAFWAWLDIVLFFFSGYIQEHLRGERRKISTYQKTLRAQFM